MSDVVAFALAGLIPAWGLYAVVARPTRQDLHNSSTNFAAAVAGWCGYTHLATGRTCLLRYRHPGPCQLNRAMIGDAPPGAVRD